MEFARAPGPHSFNCSPTSSCSNPFNLNQSYTSDKVSEVIDPTNYAEIALFLVKLYVLLGATWYCVRKTFLKKIPGLMALMEMGLSNLTTLFFSPLIVPGLVIVLTLRTLLYYYLKLVYKDKLYLMKASDGFWALDEFANSNNITVKFIVQDDNFDINKVREGFVKNIMGKKVEINGKQVEIYGERFKTISRKFFGFYCWERIPDEQFNIKDHVKFISEENERGKPIGEEEFFGEISKVYDYPLPNNKPQFEVLVAQNYIYNAGLPGSKHYAIAFRIMHSLMDGASLGNLLKNAMAENEIPLEMSVDSVTYPEKPLWIKIYAWCYIFIFGMRSFFRTLLLQESNCFHSKELTGPKTLGWTRKVCVKSLKGVKDKSKTTTTSVLYACLAGSLRKLAIKKNMEVPRTIHAFPCIAMLPYPNWYPMNRFTVSLLPLKIGLESRIERLKSAYKYVVELENSPDILMSFNVMKITGLLPAPVSRAILGLAHATCLISNNPGPLTQAVIFGGGNLIEVGCFSPLKSRLGIGMCLFSYAGKIRVCIHVDKTACPDPTDLEDLLRGFEDEIQELANHFGIPKDSIFAD